MSTLSRKNKKKNEKAAVPVFENKADAIEWMEAEFEEDGCVDNFRFGYCDDAASVAEYERLRSEGCCGSHDSKAMIGGRLAWFGCNFGH